jgi:hypothetical protein
MGHYTCAMSEHPDVSYANSTFIPFLPVRSRKTVVATPSTPPTQPSVKRSALACAVLLFYLVAYLGLGFAGVTVIERAWLAIFR